jgi:hypothetical protein
MGKHSVRKQKAKDFYKKVKRPEVKLIVPKCPHHGIEYEMESSKDPVNEGDWIDQARKQREIEYEPK